MHLSAVSVSGMSPVGRGKGAVGASGIAYRAERAGRSKQSEILRAKIADYCANSLT